MKKAALGIALFTLLAFQLYLATACLPLRWQSAIDRTLAHVLLRQSSKPLMTHPALDYEIHQALREAPLLRVGVYLFIAVLLILNALLILKIWTIFRRSTRFTRPVSK